MKQIFVAILFSLLADGVLACTCVSRPFEEDLDQAGVVMLVRVMQTRSDDESLRRPYELEAGPVRATFELVEAFKGDAAAIKELSSGYGGADCGIPLMPGLHYLVVTSPRGTVAPVSTCSATTRFGAFDPRRDSETPARRTLDAVRSYLRDHKPVDPCTGWPDLLFEKQQRGECGKPLPHPSKAESD